MATSAHAFVRGSTAKFYDWLTSTAARSLPEGPTVWICGDAHVGNLGPIARCDARVEVQIRDLDQTVVGNPAHDMIRLGLSLAMSARGSDLPGVTTAHLVEALMQGYLEALGRGPRARSPKSKVDSDAVRLVVREALRRKWRHLQAERLGGDMRLPLGSRFWPLTAAERRDVSAFLDAERIRKLVTLLGCRDDEAEISVVDAAYWVKGCSSLGLWRCAALVRVQGKKEKHGGYSLLDLKEATRPLAPRSKRASLPKHQGARVVEGARALAPALGERMVWGDVAGHQVFVRELLPQDLKLEIDQLDVGEARAVARTLGGVVGEAHARQMDRSHRERWHRALKKDTAKTRALDAPGWLWKSVVDLIGVHEPAYLEHCRRLLETA
jgi:uncharacterized protein (DUF2252 family)